MSDLRHTFVFEPGDNDSLTLETNFESNGDTGPEGVMMVQKLTLQGYGNSASFELFGTPLLPEVLHKLADELEDAFNRAVSEFDKS